MRNVALFLVIALFAGSTVVVAAKDIQKRLAPATESDRAMVQEMLRDIQGENVIPAVKAAMDKSAMPDRSQGSYFIKRDIERIKKFLVSLVKSDDSGAVESSDQDEARGEDPIQERK